MIKGKKIDPDDLVELDSDEVALIDRTENGGVDMLKGYGLFSKEFHDRYFAEGRAEGRVEG